MSTRVKVLAQCSQRTESARFAGYSDCGRGWLEGFPEALETAFPNTTVQTCIVHLIRHSLSSASSQERKALAAALKPIYRAESADRAATLLDEFERSELGQRYPDVVRSWRQKWTFVIPFLRFPP